MDSSPIELGADPDPDKFVRTFATDAAAVQAGQVPDLENKGRDAPAPSVDALGSKPSTEVASLERPAPIEKPLDLDAEQGTPIEALTPEVRSAPPSIAPIHTYKSDFADEVKEKNASQADILAAEQDARPVQEAAPKRKTDWLVVIAFLLIFIGIASAGGAYYWRLVHPTTVAAPPQPSAPIFVDSQQEISGTGSTLMSAIEQSVASPPALNTIRLLYTNDSATSTPIFNALALSSAPDILLRNIVPQGSMAGVINSSGTTFPFFILSVQSYSDTFSGMLSWEPQMESALAALYPPYPATSTTTTPIVPAFANETILNHDVRALLDAQGNAILVYGYFNQQTLVIARNEGAFSSIVDRLTNSSSTN